MTGDGVVNAKDLTRLMKFIAGESVKITDGDVNGDGKKGERQGSDSPDEDGRGRDQVLKNKIET